MTAPRPILGWLRPRAVGIVAGAVLLVGCTGGAQKTDTPPSPSTLPGTGASSTTSPGAAGGATSESGTWDPNSWRPQVQVVAPTFSDAELAAFHTESMDHAAQQQDLESAPEVSLIRWSMGTREYSANMAACLQEEGFPAVLDGDQYYFEPGVPAAQQAALDYASYVCDGQYMLHPKYNGWSDEHVGIVYDYWVEYYIPCMRAHGHDIQDDDRPSREAYVNAFHTSERISWWPNEKSQMLPMDERQPMDAICPGLPPDDVLFGP